MTGSLESGPARKKMASDWMMSDDKVHCYGPDDGTNMNVESRTAEDAMRGRLGMPIKEAIQLPRRMKLPEFTVNDAMELNNAIRILTRN